MGSRITELHQNSVGKKRKKLDARAFKALFKRQRIKEGLPDIHGKLEVPDNMSHVCNGYGRLTGSKPIGGEDVSDECCKRLKGNLRHLSIDKASGRDLKKSTGNLTRTDSEILGNNIKVESDYIDNVVAESPNPLSLADTRTNSSTPKGIDDSERLPTGCSITENTSTSKSGVDPAIAELTELQGTEVTSSKEVHSTITASILAKSLQTNDAPNSMPERSPLGADVGTGESEERFLLPSEQNCQNFLHVELRRLCQTLKLSEDVTHRVREFLEYVIKNDNLSNAPSIIHPFQLFMFSEKASDSSKDWLLADEDSTKEQSHIIDYAPLFSLSKENRAKVEIKEIVEIILKQKLRMNVKGAGSEIHDKIKKNLKKNEKRMKKLVQKQEEEVQGLLRTWEEEKVILEKDHKLESAVTHYIHGQGLVLTSKLKILDGKFSKKMEEHNLLKDMQLNSLKEKQLAARNEECQKAAHSLAEAIAYASKLGTVNGTHALGFQSENDPECTESGTHIMHTGQENSVTMSQEHAEDPNPTINSYPQGNDVAPSDASIGAPAENTDSGCLVKTMSNMETFNSPNEVGVMSRPPEIPVGQHKQLLQSCNTTEEIGPVNLPARGEQTTDEIRPAQMNEVGPTEFTRPVSDDIVLHGDPMESSYTSTIRDSIGLPSTEVYHRSEPCRSSNGSLPFPGQLLVNSQGMVAFPDHRGLLKQHVSQNEIHRVTSAELDDRDTPTADMQTSQMEFAASELHDAAVPVTRNCEQLNHLSADASLACNQYPLHEIEHQNRNQAHFSLLVAGETEDFSLLVAGETEGCSHEFVSQSSENLHHNLLDLGQASNTVLSEAVSTTELPNQSAPQIRTAAGHFHESRNNDTEITRSTSVQATQNEILQIASAELEKLDTPAVEPKNTSQTEVSSDAVTLVQSNHAVPVTGNYEQLHHLSVDASLICNESLPNEIEHQNRDQVTNFPRTVEAGGTQEFSHEFVSQRTENLHHNHLCMGQANRSSHGQNVEVFVHSHSTIMSQAVSTTELPNQSVPQLVIDAGHLRGPSHLLVNPTHPVSSWNSTPSLVAEPLQNELERLLKEAEELDKKHADAVSELKSAFEKEIQKIIHQIRAEYDKKFQDAEANFRSKKNELEKGKKLVLMNAKLAEAFRSKFQFRPLQLQQVFTSSLEQQLHRPSLPPPMRISPLASASRPPPSQRTLAPSAEVLNQLRMPPPVGSSPVAIRNVTASPPIQAIQRAGPDLPCTSARTLVIASHTPAANPHIPEIRSRAPHLQSFRPAASPSMAPSSFSAIPQRHPQPIFPPQLIGTARPATPPPPLPHLMPNHDSQNGPNPRNGQPFHLSLSQSSADLPRDMNRHVLINHNLPHLADDSTVTLGNIQCNLASSAVHTDIVCLSDDE